MNQVKNHKRTIETLPSFRGDDYRRHVINQRDTKTPEIKSRTPKKGPRNKKTPIRKEQMQGNQTESNQTLTHRPKQNILEMSQKDEPTLCQTGRIKHYDLPCQQCETYQHQISELQNSLNLQTELNNEFQQKYKQLKESYERKLKKYKVKSKMQKDELKLLKWILSQRKEFAQILQQLQVCKDNKILEKLENQQLQSVEQRINQSNRKQLNDCQEENKKEKIVNLDQSCQSQTFWKHKRHSKDPKQLREVQYQERQLTSRQESLLEQQIDILQQKVMELSIKNQFLQKIKIKPSQHLSSPIYQNNSVSFSQQMNQSYQKPSTFGQNSDSKSKRISLHSLNQNPTEPYHPRPYQYSDDEESLSKEKQNHNIYRAFSKQQNCWNLSSKQFTRCHEKAGESEKLYESGKKDSQKKRVDVQSRYISPLRERFTEENARQSSKKKSQIQEEIFKMQIPQSRSKYCDSIKERSRLLGL